MVSKRKKQLQLAASQTPTHKRDASLRHTRRIHTNIDATSTCSSSEAGYYDFESIALSSDDEEALQDPDLLPTCSSISIDLVHMSDEDQSQDQSQDQDHNQEHNDLSTSCTNLLEMITKPEIPKRLLLIRTDEPIQVTKLFYNGILLECCDMFRLIRGLKQQAKDKDKEKDRERDREKERENMAAVFYDWFEVFFAMLNCFLDFQPAQQQGCHDKKQRCKDVCWDIIQLRPLFDIYEVEHDCQVLTCRILSYLIMCVQATAASDNSFDDLCQVQAAFFNTLRASDHGKMLVCALARTFHSDPQQKNGFLDQCLRPSPAKCPKSTVAKQIRRFRKTHLDVVEKFALDQIRVVDEDDNQHDL